MTTNPCGNQLRIVRMHGIVLVDVSQKRAITAGSSNFNSRGEPGFKSWPKIGCPISRFWDLGIRAKARTAPAQTQPD